MRPRIPRRIARAIVPGVHVKVLEGPMDVEGELLVETRNTLILRGPSGKVIKVPKDRVVIMVEGRFVVPGSSLVGDPAERLVRSYG